MNACSLNRREVLGRVDPVSSEVNGHGVSQDSGEWRRENICMLHKWDWWEYVSFVMRKWEKKDTAKLERENQRFTFFLFLQSHQFDRVYGGGGVMCFCLLSSHNTLCLLSLSLSLWQEICGKSFFWHTKASSLLVDTWYRYKIHI